MLREKLINFSELERYFNAILPETPKADIDRREFTQYFDEVKKRFLKTGHSPE